MGPHVSAPRESPRAALSAARRDVLSALRHRVHYSVRYVCTSSGEATGHVRKPREAKFPLPKRPTSAVSSIAPTTTRWRRRTARTDHTHMQEKLHCDNTLHQSHQEGPQLPDARLRQQREAIEGEDSVVRPQFVLARATWRATQTGHGSGNPSASWKERTSCHGEWQRSSARLRRRARKKNGRN